MHLGIRNITVGLFNDVANFSWCCFFTLWLFSWKMWCKNLASNKIFLRSFTMRSNSNNTSNLHGLVFSWKCDWFYFVQQNFWWTKIWKKIDHMYKKIIQKKVVAQFFASSLPTCPPTPQFNVGHFDGCFAAPLGGCARPARNQHWIGGWGGPVNMRFPETVASSYWKTVGLPSDTTR